jgi:hypothetical protein
VAGSPQCVSGLGRVGVVSAVTCRAGEREERGQARAGRTGTPLRALRGPVTQTGARRRGRGGSHGHARGILFQGIDPVVRGGAGGEVTGLGTVGGELSRLGRPRRPWRRLGRGEVAGARLCQAGAV